MTGLRSLVVSLLVAVATPLPAETIRVDSAAGLREAIRKASPGTRIELAPGVYKGDCRIAEVRGKPDAMIEIVANDAGKPPVFEGGQVGFRLIDCSYVLGDGIVVQHARLNNIQAGDGSHHIILKDIVSRDIKVQSNCDGIKMPGLADFLLYNCRVENWGSEGSAVDMVGCARGLLYKCHFSYPKVQGQTANAIQPKGGTHSMGFYRCTFDEASHRAVQFGGATGKQYFFQGNYDLGYEGSDMVAMGNVIRGGGSAVAFISCTNCEFSYNTIIAPREYVARILKEGGTKQTANNTFSRNVIVYGKLSQILNHGGPKDVYLESCTFDDNYWYNALDPTRSIPKLPVAQKSPVTGSDPAKHGKAWPAMEYGADAPGMGKAWAGHTGKFAWAWEQAQMLERMETTQRSQQGPVPATGSSDGK